MNVKSEPGDKRPVLGCWFPVLSLFWGQIRCSRITVAGSRGSRVLIDSCSVGPLRAGSFTGWRRFRMTVFLRMVYLLDVVLVARKVEFTLLEFRRGGLVFPSSASMIFATTQAAEVNHNRHNQNHQINARYGLSCIHHPGICQGCQGQEQKPEQRQ